MRTRTRRSAALVSVVVAVSALALPAPVLGRELSDTEVLEAARDRAARDLGVDRGALTPLEGSAGAVRLGNRRFSTLTLATPGLRDLAFVAVDVATGEALDADAFARAVGRWEAKRDKFSPDARAALGAAGDRALVLAYVLTGVDHEAAVAAYRREHTDVGWQEDRPEGADASLVELRRVGVIEARARAVREARAAFVAAATRAGARVVATLDLAPMVYLEVRPAAAEKLASRNDVGAVLKPAPYDLAMNTARPSVDADVADRFGWDGSGIKIGIVEYSYVVWDHTGLRTVPHTVRRVSADGTACLFGRGTNTDSRSHMTWVTAIAASRATTYAGIANDVMVVESSANSGKRLASSDWRILKAAECAVLAGATVINLSIVQNDRSTYSTSNRFFDQLVDVHRITVVAASGDHGPAPGAPYNPEHCPDAKVRSPASAWNVVTVGGYTDRQTAGTADDRLWWRSDGTGPAYCWQEPAAMPWDAVNDREEPDLSAPAAVITASSGHVASGTSASAPIVTGAVATLQEHDPSLRYEPERVRALLVTGAGRDRTPKPDGRLNNDMEGWGSLNVYWSHLAVNRGDRGSNGRLDFRAAASGDATCPYRAPAAQRVTFSAVAGRRVRFVITWNSHVVGGSSVRTTDYHLVVRNPAGGVAASSARVANNFEVVQFAVDTSGGPGTYEATIVPVRWQCNPAQEAVGWAWSSY